MNIDPSLEDLTKKANALAYMFAAPLYDQGEPVLGDQAFENSLAVFAPFVFSDKPNHHLCVDQLQQILESQKNIKVFENYWKAYKSEDNYARLKTYVNENTKTPIDFDRLEKSKSFFIKNIAYTWELSGVVPAQRVTEISNIVYQALKILAGSKTNQFVQDFFSEVAHKVIERAQRHYELSTTIVAQITEQQNTVVEVGRVQIEQRRDTSVAQVHHDDAKMKR